MFYRIPLSPEAHEAKLSQPKDEDGTVKSLFYVPKGRVGEYEKRWREWLSTHPKHMWPSWVELWADKRRKERAALVQKAA